MKQSIFLAAVVLVANFGYSFSAPIIQARSLGENIELKSLIRHSSSSSSSSPSPPTHKPASTSSLSSGTSSSYYTAISSPASSNFDSRSSTSTRSNSNSYSSGGSINGVRGRGSTGTNGGYHSDNSRPGSPSSTKAIRFRSDGSSFGDSTYGGNYYSRSPSPQN